MTALGSGHDKTRAGRWQNRLRRDKIIQRLMADGPDDLAAHVYRRHTADRRRTRNDEDSPLLSWPEIAKRAKREGLLDEGERRLLARTTTDSPARNDRDARAANRDH